MDLDAKEVCAIGRISARQAAGQVVEFDGPGTVTVDWIEWSEGKVPEVLATRSLVSGALVQSMRSANRFLRFSRPQRSPLTVAASVLSEQGPWQIPDPGAGGELLISNAAAPVRPNAVRIVAETGQSWGEFKSDGQGRVRVSGLPVGPITWRSIYVGGVVGPAMKSVVAAGKSESFVVPRQDVGQLHVAFAPDLCPDVRRTVVAALRKPNPRATIRSEVASSSTDTTCQHTFGGLSPGSYEVRVHGDSIGAAVGQTTVVEVQTESRVFLDAPAVTISGTVLLGGRPYPRSDLVARFRRSDAALDTAVGVPILAAGGYTAKLPAPGIYLVEFTLRNLPFIGSSKEVTVVAGQNFEDWSIEGGNLRVKIEGRDRASPVVISFSRLGPGGSAFTEASLIVDSADGDTVELPGMTTGIYSLQARQTRPDKSVKMSATERHEVTEKGPDRDVTLVLSDYSAEINVINAAGQPVTRAVLASPQHGPLTQVAPGVFRATSKELGPGDPISVLAPDYIATCLIAPPSGSSVNVTLQSGIRTIVEVRSSVAYGVIPGWVTVPGIPCPIPLLALANDRLAPVTLESGDVISRFVVTQLPVQPGMLFQPDGLEPAIPLVRSADGVVVIRRFRR